MSSRRRLSIFDEPGLFQRLYRQHHCRTARRKDAISHKSLVRSEFRDITEMVPDYYGDPKWWSFVHRQWTFEGVRKVITLARPIRSTDKYKPIGNLQINLDQGVIANQFRQAVLEDRVCPSS